MISDLIILKFLLLIISLFFLYLYCIVKQLLIIMDRPQLYNEIKSMPTTSAIEILKEYCSLVNWGTADESVMDLGCGDGRVTVILKKHLPKEVTNLVATDININMINFAKEKYANEDIHFDVLNIEGELREEWKSGFNHVFSFLMMQFVKNQEKAFQNIYSLLTEGGDCLLTILRGMPCYELVLNAARDTKWSSNWITDPYKFVSPYYHMQDPVKSVTGIMEKIGFTNINVTCKKMVHVMKDGTEFKNFLKSVEPFKLPEDVFEELAQDSIPTAQQIGILDKTEMSFEDRRTPINFNYEIVLVYGTKPKQH